MRRYNRRTTIHSHSRDARRSDIKQLLFTIQKKINYDNLSWVTFTQPEIATFGLNPEQLRKKNIPFEKLSLDFTNDDRAIVDDDTEGRLILFVHKNKLLGGSMIAPNAGELFQELVLAKSAELKLDALFNKTYPYPTATRVNKKIIAEFFSKKLSPFAKKILRILY